MNQLARTPEERYAVFKQIDKLNRILKRQQQDIAQHDAKARAGRKLLENEASATEYKISQLMQQFPEIYYSK